MNATPKQYAAALLQSLDGRGAGELKKIIANFVALLAVNGQLDSADKIIEQFSRLWNEQNGLLEAELVSARPLDDKIRTLVKNHLRRLEGVREVRLSERTDKDLLAGAVVRYGDKVMDLSLRKRLRELKDQLVS